MILVFDSLTEGNDSLAAIFKAHKLPAHSALSADELSRQSSNPNYKLLIIRARSFGPAIQKILDLWSSLEKDRGLPALLITQSDESDLVCQKYDSVMLEYMFGTLRTPSLIAKVQALIAKRDYQKGLLTTNAYLKEELERIKKTEAIKEEFISIAGHELSTPITSINAYLQLALRSANCKNIDQTIQLLTKGLNQINKLNRIAKDLLDSSRLQAGKMQYNFAVFNCQDFLKQTVEHVKHSYPDRKINIDSPVQVWLKGDQERLEQVLTNYLTNALKYSPTNTEVLVYTQIIDKKWLKVCVKDFGAGIPADKQPYIFHKYYRACENSAKHQGLGMGLFICAQIISHHKGQFGLESETGKGSVFYFLLPIKALTIGAMKEPSSYTKGLSKKTALQYPL